METQSSDHLPLLEVRNLSKRFAGFWALQNINLTVEPRTVLAVIGPNGAGKTTLFNVLTRFISPSEGEIFYQGIDITAAKPQELAELGLVRSFQISAVFPSLTVQENVLIALQRRQRSAGSFWRSPTKQRALEEKAGVFLALVGLNDSANLVTANLPYGSRRALEIATTLAMEPTILLLDEPTAGMGPNDVTRIASLLAELKKSHTLVLVEHNLGIVAELADSIAVLNFGKIIAQGSYQEVTRNKQVMSAYLGRT